MKPKNRKKHQSAEIFNALRGPLEDVDDMVGRIPIDIVATDNELVFHFTRTQYVKFYHEQDCCESVYIESITGELNDLIGEPLLLVEVSSNTGVNEDECESSTWTFYKFASRKGYVDVRWFGASNGYYSERVDVEFYRDPN